MTGLPHRVRQHPRSADVLFAVALVLVEILFTLLTPQEFRPWRLPVAIGWSILCAAPVALRRTLPSAAVAAAVLTLVLPALLGYAPAVQSITFVVLTYTVAAHRSARAAVLAALALWTPVALLNMFRPPAGVFEVTPAYLVLNNLLVGLVAFSVGRTMHARRASTEALRERARVAEANQRSLAEQAVADERRRIARELHDMVAHHVSVMGVFATGARRVLRRDPDAADEAIATIEDTSRSTLREMRRLLDVLRADEPAAELAPQPGLAGIGSLVEQVREAGLPATFTVEGTPGPLEEGVTLTVYRIVQEALTNALKHAGPATAQVTLTFGQLWLVVDVTDTGRGPGAGAPDRIGHGLVGIHERVALYGGVLRTGRHPGGGFRVHATLPIDQLAPQADAGTRQGRRVR